MSLLTSILRLVTKEGLENLLKLKPLIEEGRSEESGTSIQGTSFYSSRDFCNAYNLMAHETDITDDMWLLRGLVRAIRFSKKNFKILPQQD